MAKRGTPPTRTRQDERAGIVASTKSGARNLPTYNADIALKICERIAQGETLTAICKEEGFPHISTFQRWVIMYEPLAKAYHAAKELSAFAFEEEALLLAREIKDDPKSGTRVRAFEVAMNQFRWSATKRNPAAFGERGNQAPAIPIQINTTLQLGPGAGATASRPNVYTLELTPVERYDSTVEQAQDDAFPEEPDRFERHKPGRRWNKRSLKPREADHV